jgi:hypothetical protein
MQDVTEHAQANGYTGSTPVMAQDGYVVSPFRQFYPDFCYKLRVERMKAQLVAGVPVTGYSIHGTTRIGEVVSVNGMNVKVRWNDTRDVSNEWLADLKPAITSSAA